MAERTEHAIAPPVRYRYPWDEWLDGGVWDLSMGEDYDDLHNLRQGAFVAARKKGLRVIVRKRGADHAFIQAVPRD